MREVYADGIPTMAGVFAPPLKTQRVEGGWRATGTSPFGSGCQNVDWLVLPMTHESRPVFAGFIRAKDGLVEDTWNTLGMRGTGSAHFGANDVFVPDYLTADPAPLTPRPVWAVLSFACGRGFRFWDRSLWRWLVLRARSRQQLITARRRPQTISRQSYRTNSLPNTSLARRRRWSRRHAIPSIVRRKQRMMT